MRAFYKLKGAMGESFHTHVGITLHLLDSLVKPILMYMSDFWGGLKPIEEKYNPIEKFHYMACKQVLGVQKQTANVGVLLELGRVPLQNFAIKAAIKNWERIRKGGVNAILWNSHVGAVREGFPWITHIKSIIQSCGLEGLSADRTRKNKHPFIHKILHEKRCGEFCRDALRGIGSPDGKLRTYALFKRDSGCEKYLHEIKNAALRQSLTKFRLSNNVLNIEKGRHTVPKTPRGKRFCPFCPGRVEDEVHFLMECPVYRAPRVEMVDAAVGRDPSFSQKTTLEQFKELMGPGAAQSVAGAIHNFFDIRSFLINRPRNLK